MYLRTEIEPRQGLGLAPVVTKVFKVVGGVVIEKVLENIVGKLLGTPEGGFTSLSNEISLSSVTSPPNKLFKSCTIDFPLTAIRPRGFPLTVSMPWKIPTNVKKKFWFRLSYKYNGNDLKQVKIIPLFAKTGKPSGYFDITFEGSPYEIEGSDKAISSFVSKVRFNITGSWKPTGSDTKVTIQGFLTVWGNGHAGIVIESEKNWVFFDSDFKPCPRLLPFVPKAPVRKLFSLRPPILFPIRKHEVSVDDVRRIDAWIKSWPSTTREKIARGDITVTIEGFASRPGGELKNLELSERRAESVKKILKSFFSNIKFDLRSKGEYSQNLPDLSDVFQWLKRFLDPQKYDQAAVIRFQDVD